MQNQQGLKPFDYEYASLNGIKEIDFIHYCFQHARLILKLGIKDTLKFIIKMFFQHKKEIFYINANNINIFITIYCLNSIMFRMEDGADPNDKQIIEKIDLLTLILKE
jgi:hypothetical protein